MNFKTKRLVDLIELEEEVVIDDLDKPDQSRLKLLLEMGIVVKVRTGSWSGQSYYGIAPDRKNRTGHQKYVC